MKDLDISTKSKVSHLLNTQLFSGEYKENEIYNLIDTNITIDNLNDIYQDLLKNKLNLKNLGIDLPYWFGDFNSNEKTMVIALDPKRNKQNNKKISVGSIFSIHSEEAKTTKKNYYWDFISHLAQTGFIYLTDIYKIYYETKDNKRQNLLSNKDKEYTKGDCYEHNKYILDIEINEIVKPNRIVTLGRDAADAVKAIRNIETDDIKHCQDKIEYIFLPHISRTVTQSIKTIGNLYKGLGIITQKEEIQNIGENLLKHSDLKQMLTDKT